MNVFDVHVNRTPAVGTVVPACLSCRQVPQRLVRQGLGRERAPVVQDPDRRAAARSGSSRSPGWWPGGSSPSSRRGRADGRAAGRPDPLRQPLRRLPAARGRAAGPGRPAHAGRRDRAGRSVRQPTQAPGTRRLMMLRRRDRRVRLSARQAGPPGAQHAHHPGPVRRDELDPLRARRPLRAGGDR